MGAKLASNVSYDQGYFTSSQCTSASVSIFSIGGDLWLILPDPIAMSVRSTNVYEENSLGIFEEDVESVDENFTPTGSTATVWSRYLALHMRKQLSFGTDFSVR